MKKTRQKTNYEVWVEKYGKEEADIIHQAFKLKMKKTFSKEGYIEKYGEEDGLAKWNDLVEKRKATKENMIRRYGEEIGYKKWDTYIEKQKKVQTKEGMIERYGEEKGLEVFNKRVDAVKESNAGDGNSMSLKSIAKRHGVSEEEARELTPCFGRKDEKHPMYGKHQTDEARRKISEGVCESKPWAQVCKKEQSKCHDLIKENYPNLIWEYVVKLGDSYISADMYIPEHNLIVEYYGDYWHMNPKIFKEDFIHDRLKCTSKERWEKDEIRENKLLSAGYNLMIIWASDFAKKEYREKINENIENKRYRTNKD